ncbi:PREDICTED: tRNA (cytosine(34)-C(5))-methyltransferase isoform X2 [Nicrophorus vespilloides]|uniref:tRNA (cytosine(34)-C(5))-methyltransferase n=1 Tax=Nicrophorus vespilloides TaxID=110193 RepID=A0ABM1M3U4_NICVS|nr:PREDICTED: tRNA (cytosine(34)-C(5))-methyltransferase isoform X2 [Nicrophorus vespilloides]
MGKRKAGFRKGRASRAKAQPGEDNRIPYQDIVKGNEKFEQYYKTVGICKESEWDEFMQSIKSDLPTTFRITGSKSVAKKMVEVVKGQFLKDCLNNGHTNEFDTTIYPLPWYPDNLAWQMNLTKKEIRREEAFYKLHNFLIMETENGTISRQETVSMLPPLVLDVKPHHTVLDMCAAPGSKTAQLLEMLHGEDDAIPSGYVIANDVDNKRCYMLVHQAKRLNSPCLAVINHDSAILPNLTCSMPNGSMEQVQFDRILCDVPCSGDGTLRKNPDIWMKWTQANAINLHGVQSRIFRRGCELLKVGGRLVYSTCSLNPLENEAVIHRLLSETDGAMRLVDVTSTLPGLNYSPGMESWVVGSRNLEFYKTWEEVDENWRTTIRPQMFPPKPEDRAKYELNKCIRILPHQQNTGAFFVAVLEKLKPISPKEKSFKIMNAEEERLKKEKEDRLPENQRKRRRRDGYREDPFVFFKEDEDVWPDIKSFYELSDDFDCKNLLVRCTVGKKKNIYLTSSAMRDLVIQNQGTIKFINTGVKLFVRSDNRNMKKCPFRIANDGLESIFNSIGPGRRVTIPKDDLITLLMNDTPDQAPLIESLSEVVQAQLKDLAAGSCVLIYKEEGEDGLVLHLSGWRGTTTLRVYMAHCNSVHLLRLLGGDVSKFDINKFQKAKDEVAKKLAEEEKASDEAETGEEEKASDEVETKTEENVENKDQPQAN